MTRSLLSLAASLALVLPGAVACGSADGMGGDDETAGRGATARADDIATNVDALAWRTRSRLRTPSTTTAAPAATTAPSSSADVAAAARTADGQAIPQAAGPGGQCPATVVTYGFWSCVTIGEQCSYAAGGVTHQCTCSRVDGEGQAPEWLCN
jgi:hypothetical protein